MPTTYKWSQRDFLLRDLKSLPAKLQRKAVSKAMRKGASIVRNSAATKAKRFDRSETPLKVWKEIAVRTNARLGRQNGGYALSIGVKGGARRYTNNARNRRARRVGQSYEGPGKVYYWRFLEFGTQKMKAQPFMRPALSENVEQVMDVVAAELDTQLTQLVGTP